MGVRDIIYATIDGNGFVVPPGHAPRDGSLYEGAVAAFLVDVVDPMGQDGIMNHELFQDGVQLSPSVVTGVVNGCKVFTYYNLSDITDHATIRANGVDHWAYCLEQEMRRVDISWYSVDKCGSMSPWACSGYNSAVVWDNSFHPDIPVAYFTERRTGAQTAGHRVPQYPVAWQMNGNPPDPYLSSRPGVRHLWLCNLYAQRCASGSVQAPYP